MPSVVGRHREGRRFRGARGVHPNQARSGARFHARDRRWRMSLRVAAGDTAEPGASAVTLAAARKGAVAAAREIERFYAERYGEARGREVEDALTPLASRFAERGGRLTERELQPLLRDLARRDSIPGDRRHLLNTLSDIGFLWETPPTGWELGIPSFADFLLAHHGDA